MRRRVLVLLGPTAVGKTAVAVELCRLLNGEVVAADSRQIYRGVAIGSAAPTPDELAAAPHHLIGFLDPQVAYSVAEFRQAAEAALHGILDRGRTPILVAGTGMWLKALVAGWSLTRVRADPELRGRLSAEADEQGLQQLHQRLAELDPEAAERIAPADRKRIIRALEVYLSTGTTLTEHHRTAGTTPVPFDYELFGLRRPREELVARIDRRVEAMLAAGWLDEIDSLLQQELTGEEPAMEGLGYRPLVGHLRGELSLDEATELIRRDTRRFAKRQMTWFRALPGVRWIEVGTDDEPGTVAARIARAWAAGGEST